MTEIGRFCDRDRPFLSKNDAIIAAMESRRKGPNARSRMRDDRKSIGTRAFMRFLGLLEEDFDAFCPFSEGRHLGCRWFCNIVTHCDFAF